MPQQMLPRTRMSRVINTLKLNVKAFAPLALVGSSLLTLGLGSTVMLDYILSACFRFAREGAFGSRSKDSHGVGSSGGVTELTALTSFGQAQCDIVLGAGRGSAQLASRLDEAHHQVDPLVFARVCRVCSWP